MISKFKFIKSPHFSSQIQSIKNPNKTLIHISPQFKLKTLIHNFPQFKPNFNQSKTLKMSSISCTSCTFLNPPSQKLTCQICQTPFPISSSKPSSIITSSEHKWSCKACTFLNSYSKSNCEICDTRIPSINLDSADDFTNPSFNLDHNVGSVFFPLRKCSSSSDNNNNNINTVNKERVSDLDYSNLDSGIRDGIGKNVAGFCGDSKNLVSNKRKFQEPVLENSDDFYDLGTNIKEDNGEAALDPQSAEIVDDSECGIVFKRKRDRVEKPFAGIGFRDVKSSKKQTTILDEKVRTIGAGKGSVSAEVAENSDVKNVSAAIKILSYNVWFRDELEGYLRMQAIGNLIQLHSPDIICFQEVNYILYDIFQKSPWWKKYRCSVSFERSQNEAYFCMQLAKIPVKSFSRKPFSYTMMSRELCVVEIQVNEHKSLAIATTHLESPCPGPPTWDQMYSKERVNQAKEAITSLQQYPNVIFCGDMNWDEKKDGRFPFTEGWFDAWERLRPAEIGYTYDTKSNRMLSGNRALQKRLDRFICHLPDFMVTSIEMIGTEAIPGLEYKKEKKVRGKVQEVMLPVYPSDHYGLLLTITAV